MATLYDRIRERREACEMSQSELAERLGYKDRSTIAKIEKGVNDITQSKIEAFARELHTTPAYLMGWTNDWYDYEADEDDRFSTIPTAQFEALMDLHKNDLEEVWHAWVKMQADTYAEAMTQDKAPVLIKEDRHQITDNDIKFALFGDTEIDDDVLDEVKRFAQFAKEQRRQKEKTGD